MQENLIVIKFNDAEEITTRKVFQWNKGQYLIFEDIEDGIEVQFYNNASQKTINNVIEGGQVKIPSFLMERPMDIKGFIEIVNTDSETTIKKFTIPMSPRPKPGAYVPDKDIPTFAMEMKQIMEETKDIAEDVQRRADSGEFKGEKGDKGDDYIITEDDYDEIALKTYDLADTDLTEKVNKAKESIDTIADEQINNIQNVSTENMGNINDVTNVNIGNINNISNENIGNINNVAKGQIDAINNTTNAQIDVINNTANEQISTINSTSNTNISAINKVTNDSIGNINNVTNANLKSVNDTGLANVNSINYTIDTVKKDINVYSFEVVEKIAEVVYGTNEYTDYLEAIDYVTIKSDELSCYAPINRDIQFFDKDKNLIKEDYWMPNYNPNFLPITYEVDNMRYIKLRYKFTTSPIKSYKISYETKEKVYPSIYDGVTTLFKNNEETIKEHIGVYKEETHEESVEKTVDAYYQSDVEDIIGMNGVSTDFMQYDVTFVPLSGWGLLDDHYIVFYDKNKEYLRWDILSQFASSWGVPIDTEIKEKFNDMINPKTGNKLYDDICYIKIYIQGAGTTRIRTISYMVTEKTVIRTLVEIGEGMQHYVDEMKETLGDFDTVMDAVESKVDDNQGADNKGKILGIDEDGNVVPVDMTSGEPDEYIKDATVEENTLILVKKDGSEVKFVSDGDKNKYEAGDNIDISEDNVISSTAIAIQDEEPTTNSNIWIKPNEDEEFSVPEIKDDEISEEDTWSSKKISDEIDASGGSGESWEKIGEFTVPNIADVENDTSGATWIVEDEKIVALMVDDFECKKLKTVISNINPDSANTLAVLFNNDYISGNAGRVITLYGAINWTSAGTQNTKSMIIWNELETEFNLISAEFRSYNSTKLSDARNTYSLNPMNTREYAYGKGWVSTFDRNKISSIIYALSAPNVTSKKALFEGMKFEIWGCK